MKKHIFLGAMLCLMASTPAWAQPKAFVQNVGQITDPALQHRKDIDFKVSQQKGLQVYVGNGSLHYQWIEATAPTDSTTLYDAYRLDMQLIGANPNATISYGQKEATYERYFLSWVNTDNSNEGKVAHYYQSVVYHNIYPKIDWKLYFTADGHLEYDFIVHPGGNVQDIQLQYNGADSVRLHNDGGLRIYTPKGSIAERAPYSFDAQTKQVVASQFVVNKQSVSFQTAPHQGTLVIDPVIEWGTYFGGVDAESFSDVAYGQDGNYFAVGTTSSVGNIATIGAHQQVFAGGVNIYGGDGLITKWSSDGQLQWATYYGGPNVDKCTDVVVGSDSCIYILGVTNSNAGIATSGSYKDTLSGNGSTNDVFISKFNSNGVRYWSSYYGGSNQDGNTGTGFDIHADGDLFITFNTLSNNILVSSNAMKATNGITDAFIMRLNNDGWPKYATYFGGSAEDIPLDIKVDYNKNIVVVGATKSSSDIASQLSYQSNIGGLEDGFILRIDSMGLLLWSTYFGGASNDRLNAVTIADSFLVVGGQTRSSIDIASPGAHQTVFRGGPNGTFDDGMLACFSLNGDRVWSTYYGGPSYDYIYDVSIMNDSLIYCLMTTRSDTNIVTINSINSTFSGGVDLALIKMNKEGVLRMGTYIGGSDIENTEKFAITSSLEVLLCGRTLSGSNISYGNSYQNNLNNGYDAFIMKYFDCDAPIMNGVINGLDSLCNDILHEFSIPFQSDVVKYNWNLPAGWQGTSDSNSIMLTTGTHGGTIQVWAESSCGGISDTLSMLVYIHPTSQVLIAQQGNILRSNATYPSYQWFLNGQAIPGATNSTYIPTTNGSYSLSVVDANGCTAVSNSLDIGHLSIAGLEPGSYSLYPNPMEQVLHIQVAQATTVYITNVLGQLVWQQSLASGTHSIAVASWSAGMYAVVLQQGEKRAVHKIIKH